MENLNTDILVENIKKLMDDNNVTQQGLADILDMSQSNVSKALSLTDKKCFTFNQIYGIAKHFGVSIDMLVGIHTITNKDVSPRSIAEYFVQLVESDVIEIIKYVREEDIFEPDYDPHTGDMEIDHRKEKVEYNAFFFPSYWHIPEGLTYEEEGALWSEMTQCGNDTIHWKTNKFFHQFLQIHALYKQKALEEETYRTVVTDLLNHLK